MACGPLRSQLEGHFKNPRANDLLDGIFSSLIHKYVIYNAICGLH